MSVCVGPVTAARAVEVGLPHVVATSPSRLGPMVRTLTEVLAARAHHVELAGVELRVQGSCLFVGDRVERLTHRERALLEVLLGSRGAVVSKQVLSERAWDDPAGDHTVEVTVNRLRGKLGPAADALETRNRRGLPARRRVLTARRDGSFRRLFPRPHRPTRRACAATVA